MTNLFDNVNMKGVNSYCKWVVYYNHHMLLPLAISLRDNVTHLGQI